MDRELFISLSQARYELECLDRLGQIQNDSFSDGLLGMLCAMRGELRANAIGVLWYDGGRSAPEIIHSIPEDHASVALLKDIADHRLINTVLEGLADSGEEQACVEADPHNGYSGPWHEIVRRCQEFCVNGFRLVDDFRLHWLRLSGG